MAPPSSGALTVIQILKMLERFPLGDASAGYGFGSVEDAERDGRSDAHRLRRPCRLDGRRRLRAGADQGPDQRDVPRGAQRHDRAGRAHDTRSRAGDPRPFETAGLDAGHRAGDGGAGRRPGERHHALLGGRQVGQRRLVHQHHRVRLRHRRVRGLQARRRLVPQPRLPAEQRTDRLQPDAEHATRSPASSATTTCSRTSGRAAAWRRRCCSRRTASHSSPTARPAARRSSTPSSTSRST